MAGRARIRLQGICPEAPGHTSQHAAPDSPPCCWALGAVATCAQGARGDPEAAFMRIKRNRTSQRRVYYCAGKERGGRIEKQKGNFVKLMR